jgi:hypothetical protein
MSDECSPSVISQLALACDRRAQMTRTVRSNTDTPIQKHVPATLLLYRHVRETHDCTACVFCCDGPTANTGVAGLSQHMTIQMKHVHRTCSSRQRKVGSPARQLPVVKLTRTCDGDSGLLCVERAYEHDLCDSGHSAGGGLCTVVRNAACSKCVPIAPFAGRTLLHQLVQQL